jgi:hypothetical protein
MLYSITISIIIEKDYWLLGVKENENPKSR